jgi:hypothetical protein
LYDNKQFTKTIAEIRLYENKRKNDLHTFHINSNNIIRKTRFEKKTVFHEQLYSPGGKINNFVLQRPAKS